MKSHILTRLIFFPLLGFFLLPDLSFGELSVIDTLGETLPTIVGVTATSLRVHQPPSPYASVDQSAGKTLITPKARIEYGKRKGAGIIVDSRGLIATNYHIVANASTVTVTLSDGTDAPAYVVSIFPRNDLALLSINLAYRLPCIRFTDASQQEPGHEVFSIGHSQLLSHTISDGQITGVAANGEQESGLSDYQFLRVNMNLYKGDSGGPLLNRQGQLVGLIVGSQQKKDRSSFAIPASKIKAFYLEYCKAIQKNN